MQEMAAFCFSKDIISITYYTAVSYKASKNTVQTLSHAR